MEMSGTWSWNLGPFWSESLCTEKHKRKPPFYLCTQKKRQLYNVTELASTSMGLELRTKLQPLTFKWSWFSPNVFFLCLWFWMLATDRLYCGFFTGMHEVFKGTFSNFSSFFSSPFLSDMPLCSVIGPRHVPVKPKEVTSAKHALSPGRKPNCVLKTSNDALGGSWEGEGGDGPLRMTICSK